MLILDNQVNITGGQGDCQALPPVERLFLDVDDAFGYQMLPQNLEPRANASETKSLNLIYHWAVPALLQIVLWISRSQVLL